MKRFIQNNGVKIFFIIFFGIIVAIFCVQKMTVTEMKRTESLTVRNIPVAPRVNRPLTTSVDNNIETSKPDVINSDQIPKPSKPSTESQSPTSQRVYERSVPDLFLPQ